MKVQELAKQIGLRPVTKVYDRDVTGVFISDMVSDVIANAKGGDLLVTAQAHANVIAAANLIDTSAVVITQDKPLAGDVVKMAEKAEIAVFTTPLNRWQMATKLYEAGIR